MTGSFTVIGIGPTTNRAYQDALAAKAQFTEGDERTWLVTNERYDLKPGFDKDNPVICTLELELVERYA